MGQDEDLAAANALQQELTSFEEQAANAWSDSS
jgi:hypothetical protein